MIENAEPWVDIPTARCLLRWLLAGGELACLHEPSALAAWLTRQGLGALAYGRCGDDQSALRRRLQADMFAAAAESSLRQAQLHPILEAFARADLPLVLLKGGGVEPVALRRPCLAHHERPRPLAARGGYAAAAQLMAALGYVTSGKEARPFQLQQLSRGEIPFYRPGLSAGLVEFHWSPFSGWWLARTAVIDEAGLWARREPVAKAAAAHLASEDMVIHLAVHTAVNHQFDLSALRSLVDMALTAQKRGVDWAVVAERARAWRVGTAVYTVLDVLDQLFELDGLAMALDALRTSRRRRWLIGRFVTPERVLAGHDLRAGWQRFLLLLLLVDRKRDMGKLVGRTLWPEPEWLAARYSDDAGHWRHLWRW
ncbi:MAG: nucleotidyltransferase family protein [Chloroflexi bacterium]|nr:nucleotidyltransferase family protein [Chloroflexota bacterium]